MYRTKNFMHHNIKPENTTNNHNSMIQQFDGMELLRMNPVKVYRGQQVCRVTLLYK